MVPVSDNELMCRVGPATAMGKAIRYFWLPALASSELADPGGDPVHVELLGENFVAFRDRQGNIGLLDEHCCHRGASLTVGRVENCGIRCIYHGWLFGADGTVMETPNVTERSPKGRFKTRAYPVREAGGMIWTYLGDPAKTPAFPDFPWATAEEAMRLTAVTIIGCNYVQLIEGLLDSSHLTILHSTALQRTVNSDLNFAKATSHMRFDAAPRIEVEEADFGLRYAAIRNVDGKAETRITSFIAPFWMINPNGDIVVAVVPMSDEKSAFYTVWWDGQNRFGEEPLRSQSLDTIGVDQATLEKYGHTRATFGTSARASRENGWHQDRTRMTEGHFSGAPTLFLEDVLVCLSAGPLRSRSRELLTPADSAVASLYRLLIRSARAAAEGQPPIGSGVSIAEVRGVNKSLPLNSDWRSLLRQETKHDVIAAD
jgi:phenylpropionate dioxygenase-like ring-hydroxylating dioxygenase large terminal subunit